MPTNNKGGCPSGSTKAAKIQAQMNSKLARNYVCLEYAETKSKAGRRGVAHGLREKLIKEVTIKFEINSKLDVPRTTIISCIKASNLEVFNTGVSSPVLDMEPYLVAIVISAWECNYPLTIGECTLIAHKLVEGTVFAENIIKFKKEWSQYDPDAPLLGSAWWKDFRKRKILIVESKVGRTFTWVCSNRRWLLR